jgi:PAS domain S-box-containing protein
MTARLAQPECECDPAVISGWCHLPTILSVDDDGAVRGARNEILCEAGFEVVGTLAGTDALRLAVENQPSLVVFALDLAAIDSLAVSERLKPDPGTGRIPVLRISARGERGLDHPESLRAEAFLQPPVAPAVLVALLTALLQASGTTARKRAEASLRENEERLQLFVENAPAAIAMFDRNMRYAAASRRWMADYALDGQDLIGRSHYEVFPEIPERWKDIHRRCLAGAVEKCDEDFFPRANGDLDWIRWEIHPWRNEKGEIGGIIIFSEQITDRKRAEIALRASEEKYRTLFETMAEGFALDEIVYDEAGKPCDLRCLSVNPAFERQTGLKAGDMLGRTTRELFPQAGPVWLEKFGKVALTGEPARFEASLGPLGRWFGMSAFQTEPGRVGVVFTDITDRKQAEDALRESEQRFRIMADGCPALIWVTDAEGGLRFANNAYRDYFGITHGQVEGAKWQPLVHPDDAREYAGIYLRALRERTPFETEARVRRADGEWRWVASYGESRWSPGGEFLGHSSISLDIDERKRSEARLREAQKLESLGLLAGGVAHDFNNLLVGVIGNASLARDMLPPSHPAVELLDGVIKTGEQAAHLTRQMLAYSGKGKFVVEALDLSSLIPEMAGLVRTSISKKIAMHLDLEENLPPIQADRGQMQQVFMNLALNAAEAIGSQEGLIAIRTGVQDVNERYGKAHPESAELPPGKYIFLEVRDTGCGMDDATRARIFDPFFSTKFMGRGLGLAAVAGILRGHKGAITVSSAPGKGSCFTVLFAAAEGTSRNRPAAAPKVALQGSGVVLVVDDEKLVREMVKKALEQYGYTVLLADSGFAAVDLLKTYCGDIALVVLDLSMPRMGGEEALRELRKIRPEVKVLVSSGYSEAETMTFFSGQPVSGFIQKPYTGSGLAEKVKTCLE